MPQDEAQLIQDTLNGKLEAFDELLQRYQNRVYNFLLRMCQHEQDAEDLAQEVFIKAYESLGDFQAKSSFYTWLYRIAANTFFSNRRHLSSRKIIKTIPIQSAVGDRDRAPELPSSAIPDPGQAVQSQETMQVIHDAINQLSEDHRVVTVLRHVEEMDCQQISDVLGWPIGTVKSRLHRARKELRDNLAALSG